MVPETEREPQPEMESEMEPQPQPHVQQVGPRTSPQPAMTLRLRLPRTVVVPPRPGSTSPPGGANEATIDEVPDDWEAL